MTELNGAHYSLLKSLPKLSPDCGTNARVVELGLQFYKKEGLKVFNVRTSSGCMTVVIA